MSDIPEPSTPRALEDARRRNRIGIVLIVLALISTAFAWTGVSLKDIWAALHF